MTKELKASGLQIKFTIKDPNMLIKSQLSSKTLWFNVIMFVLFVISIPEFIPLLPAPLLPWIGILTTVGNYILRTFFTSQPITEFAAEQKPSQG
jgi:hypothetical protein